MMEIKKHEISWMSVGPLLGLFWVAIMVLIITGLPLIAIASDKYGYVMPLSGEVALMMHMASLLLAVVPWVCIIGMLDDLGVFDTTNTIDRLIISFAFMVACAILFIVACPAENATTRILTVASIGLGIVSSVSFVYHVFSIDNGIIPRRYG